MKPYVLVIDDDEDVRDSITDLLEARGHNVQAAANGRDALEILNASTAPCMILLDLMMPVMDGWEFAAHLAQDPRLCSIPTCIVTAGGQTQPTPAGVTCIVEKPFRPDDLLAVVERLC